MLKFHAILEDGSQHILKFENLKEFWNWTGKNYIKEIQTLDNNSTYSFMDLDGNTVADDLGGN
jgi:hypothetical protein